MPDSVRRLGIVLALAAMSFLAAFGLFYLLDSTASIENKGLKLGGAAAGFAVVFFILQKAYFRQWREERDEKSKSGDERIRALEEQIAGLVVAKLDNFVVPDNYEPEISTEFNFGFAYPSGWNFSRFPKQTQYCFVADPQLPGEGFSRNVTIMIGDISEYEGDLADLFRADLQTTLDALNQGELAWSEDFLFHGLTAQRWLVNWQAGGRRISAYQIVVADRDRRNVYTITFTTTQDDFATSRPLFDNIASTFRV